MALRRHLLFASALVIGAGLVVGCTPSVEDAGDVASSAPEPSAVDASAPIVDDDALAERERFLNDQQQPRDGSPLVAVTAPQQALIAAQRAHVESQGGAWSAEVETITLAVALDACESSILNGHEVSTETVAAHIGTSPLFAGYEPGSAQARGLASIMVFGTGYLCADDAPQWEAAYAELYGP